MLGGLRGGRAMKLPIAIVVSAALIAGTTLVTSYEHRYALTEAGGFVYQLDQRTGEMRFCIRDKCAPMKDVSSRSELLRN